MKTLYGNLIDLAELGEFDVIIHGANCQCVMGGGIAAEIKNRYPLAFEADLKTRKGDITKLGKYSYANVISNLDNNIKFTIINAYTQYKYWGTKPHVNYRSIKEVMQLIKKDFCGKKIGYPLIGAGLAGGNWELIKNIIEDEFRGENHTLVIYKK